MSHLKYPPRVKAAAPNGGGQVTVRKMTKKQMASMTGKRKIAKKVDAAKFDKAGTRVGIWGKRDKDPVKVDRDTLAANDGELRGRWLA